MFCCCVVWPLQGYLLACGLETEVVEGRIHANEGIWNHFWLKLPDNRILDPTADQFSTPEGEKMPRTYLGKKPNWYKTVKLTVI